MDGQPDWLEGVGWVGAAWLRWKQMQALIVAELFCAAPDALVERLERRFVRQAHKGDISIHDDVQPFERGKVTAVGWQRAFREAFRLRWLIENVEAEGTGDVGNHG